MTYEWPELALSVDSLNVDYHSSKPGTLVAVENLSLSLPRGETVAIVGESGSGKSTTLHALIGLLPDSATFTVRRLALESVNGSQEVSDPRQLRGSRIGLIPQDHATALDPLVRIERHFLELHRHFGITSNRSESRKATIDALKAVGIDTPEQRLRQYPHQLSGGTRQRILIALALVGDPHVLLADEPTSNLDATVQQRVLDLLDRIRAERGLSILFVTHDIAVAAERSSHMIVMRNGKVVESGSTPQVLSDPQTAYTRKLLTSVPSNLPPRVRFAYAAEQNPVIEATGLSKAFRSGPRGTSLVAVDDLSLTLYAGSTLGIVGESGAGKSTALRLVAGLERPDCGQVRLDGRSVHAHQKSRTSIGRHLQLVYQNPARSLNPALTVAQVIAEPLEALRVGSRPALLRRAHEFLEHVELPTALASRRVGELSGGQQQRVAIARAIAPEPRVVILDEPVSALDQSVQFAIMQLLTDLQRRLGIAYILVSHDLSVVRALADEVIVMHRGLVVERGEAETVLAFPASPHTEALLNAMPIVPTPITL